MMATKVLEPGVKKPDKVEGREGDEPVLKRSRKPPKDGPCRGCGKDVPLNRLMLCYLCWVKKRNSDKGWREGQPHPAGCGCAIECSLESKGSQN